MDSDLQTEPFHHGQEEDSKLTQLNLLLDKAKMYSQFIGQQLKGTQNDDDSTNKISQEISSSFLNHRHVHKQPEIVTGGKMREYQIEGMNWLIQLYENGMNGILADEMGLGKTLITISFLSYLWTKGVRGPFLIVAPLSTLENWMNEISHWSPSIPHVLYHGPKSERAEVKRQLAVTPVLKKRKTNETQSTSTNEIPIIVTSFEIAINDRRFFQKFNWKYIIVDEGHRLKNFNCKLIRELRQLNSDNRLLLTGTPLQNNLTELWSLLNFILPDVFDSLQNFQSWFDFDEVVDHEQVNGGNQIEKGTESQLIKKLHSILQPFLLRRLKADLKDHLNIPVKKHLVIYCPFTKVQKEFYDTLKEFGTDIFSSPKSSLQNLLMQLRKVCNHPFLFDADFDEFHMKYKEKNYDFKAKIPTTKRNKKIVEESTRKRSTTAFQFFCNDERKKKKKSNVHISISELSERYKNLSLAKKKEYEDRALKDKIALKEIIEYRRLKDDPNLFIGDPSSYIQTLKQCSGKFNILDGMLSTLKKGGHKCLIFSQMTRMLDILEDFLDLSGYKYCRIDGSVPREERQNMINNFNNDSSYFCFLLSTRAGGLGINLTSADTVIIYDSDWNPQMDLQAQDRCHRIGQKRPVVVYRLITANSVESKILKRANAKIKLERLVIHKERFKGLDSKIISDEDVFDILKSDEMNGSLGGDKVISDEDLLNVLDRQKCLEMFDDNLNSKDVYHGIELLENNNDGQVIIGINDNEVEKTLK